MRSSQRLQQKPKINYNCETPTLEQQQAETLHNVDFTQLIWKANYEYLQSNGTMELNNPFPLLPTNLAPANYNWQSMGNGGSFNLALGTESKLISVPEQGYVNQLRLLGMESDVDCKAIDLTKSPKNLNTATDVVKPKRVRKRKEALPSRKRKITKKVADNTASENDVSLFKRPRLDEPAINYLTLLNNYHNPVTNANIPPILRSQPLENGGPYFDNAIDPRLLNLNSVQQSFLPHVYPSHFSQQLLPETVANLSSQLNNLQPHMAADSHAYGCPTPDLTQRLDLSSPSSTQSFGDSIYDLLGNDDIREILNIKKPIFRLNLQHLQTLALVLNLDSDYLCGLIEKILKLDTNLLQKISAAFYTTDTNENEVVKKTDVKPCHDFLTPDESTVVNPSQSPRCRYQNGNS